MSQFFGIDDECIVVNLLCFRLALYIRNLGVGKLEAASLAINPQHKECRLHLTSYDVASSPFLLLVTAEKEMLSSSYLSTQVLDELPIWKVYSEIAADFSLLRQLVEDLCNSHTYDSDDLTRLSTLSVSPMCHKKLDKRIPSSSNVSPKVGESTYCGKMRHSPTGKRKWVDKKQKMVSVSPIHLHSSPVHLHSSPVHSRSSLVHSRSSLVHSRSSPIHSRSSDVGAIITHHGWNMLGCIQQLVSFTQIRLCMASNYRDIVINKPWTTCGGYSTAISVLSELRNAASELLHCKLVQPLRELVRAELLTTKRALVLCDAFSKHDMFNTSMSLVQLRSAINEYRNYLGLGMEEEEAQPIPRILSWANAVASSVERRFPLFFPWASVERLDGNGLVQYFEAFVNDCVLSFETSDIEEESSSMYAVAALVLDFVAPLDSTIGLSDGRRRTPSVDGSYVFPFTSQNSFVDQGVVCKCKYHKLRKNDNCRVLISSQWHIIDNPVTTDNETPSVQCDGVSYAGIEATPVTADGAGIDTPNIIFIRYASKRDESVEASRPDHIDLAAHSTSSSILLSNDVTITNLHCSGDISSTKAAEIPDAIVQSTDKKGYKAESQHNIAVQGIGELPVNSTTYPTSIGCTQDLWPLIKSAMLDDSENTLKKSELMDFGLPVAFDLADSGFQTMAYVARATQRLDLVLAVRSDKRHTYEAEVMKFANCVLHQLRDEVSFEELLPKRQGSANCKQ